MADRWEDLGPASFQADGETAVLFMVRGQLQSDGSLRLVRREVPWREGEKLDETGPNADEHDIEAPFFNTLMEPGIGPGAAVYPQVWPDRLNLLWAQFRLGKTGTLHLPWKRNIRCKAATYRRVANIEGERQGETLTVKFVEDNEDDLDRAAAENISTRANVLRVIVEARFDAESIGAWDGAWEDITEFASDLEGVLNAPAEWAADIAHKARRVMRAADSIRTSLTSRLDGRNQLSDPDGEPVLRRLLLVADLAARAEAEARSSLPATITRVWQTDRDIYSIASELGQSARDLISINGQLEDPGYIPANTPVLVFA